MVLMPVPSTSQDVAATESIDLKQFQIKGILVLFALVLKKSSIIFS